jgi:nucleoside-diphosphate-sugar epimerase
MGLRILLVGASGTIGSAVGRALEREHEVLRASRSKSEIAVDITDTDSIRARLQRPGPSEAPSKLSGGHSVLESDGRVPCAS